RTPGAALVLIRATLGEYPLHQFRFGESPFPCIVVYASVLRVEGPASGFPSCRDTVTRHGHRNGLVGVPVEVPQWRTNPPGAVLGRDASTPDHRRGEKPWAIRDHIPHARASHGLPRHVDTPLINRELAAQAFDNLQRQPCPVPKAGEHFRRPRSLLRKIVSDPSPIGLRY